ncbi:uncharacterized protein EV154DRAFT_567350 [Mucor mucedo]|uniref:uncharacterized protein n=1 Tax=Mucor mucedo TaxID=29922 RepID=UPI00221EA7F8|nr:uncharacterized protein EV154DRAFT_567350 [Mucor mucedo]KAI7887559.1 hypothetical protein EV154DRAFT_567350 [Mucor mucedo]
MTATCEIFITAVFPKMNEDRWIIECHNDGHNHDMLEDDKKLCLVKNRQLHYEQQRTIDEVHVANAKTSAIVAAVNNVKCTKTRESAKDITNQPALFARALNKRENQRHMNRFIRNFEEKGSSLSNTYEEIGSERIEDGFHELLCRFGMGTDETKMTYDRFFKTLKTKEEYDQVFSSQTNSNRWDNVAIRKDVVIPLSSVDARWIVGKLAWSNNSNPLESVHQLLSAEMYTKTNATDTNLHTLRQDIEEVPFEHVRKEKLDVISHTVDSINDKFRCQVLQPLKKKELALKQVTFDDSTIIEDSIKLYLILRCVGMLQFMLKHVASVTKVLGEGNCGFRSVAAYVGGDEVIRVALSLVDELLGAFEKDEVASLLFRFGVPEHY